MHHINNQGKHQYKKHKRFNNYLLMYIILFITVIILGVVYIKYMNNLMIDVLTIGAVTDNYNNTLDTSIYNRLMSAQNDYEVNQLVEFHKLEDNYNDSVNNVDSSETAENITYNVPSGHSFKSFTYYTSLSSHSLQGKLQQSAYTDENGLRKVDEYYCAALGTYYANDIGDKYLVTLSTGVQFKMILCDVKSDAHTDINNQYTKSNGCVIEFYVDKSKLNNKVKVSGNISSIPGFEGDIISIDRIGE